MANADGSSNVRVNKKRHDKLKQARLEIMVSGAEEARISEIIGHLIDHYLTDAVKDLKDKK